MSSVSRNLLIGAVVALFLLGSGYLLLSKKSAPPMANQTTGGASTSTTVIPGTGIVVTGDATVKETPVQTTIPAPDWHRPVIFPSSVPADAVSALNAQFASIQKTLASDPTNFDAWIDLGIIRKMVSDYTGAAEDWTYVAKLYPHDTIAFDSLGDLYLNYIHDTAKAKASYSAALKINPNDTVASQALAHL